MPVVDPSRKGSDAPATDFDGIIREEGYAGSFPAVDGRAIDLDDPAPADDGDVGCLGESAEVARHGYGGDNIKPALIRETDLAGAVDFTDDVDEPIGLQPDGNGVSRADDGDVGRVFLECVEVDALSFRGALAPEDDAAEVCLFQSSTSGGNGFDDVELPLDRDGDIARFGNGSRNGSVLGRVAGDGEGDLWIDEIVPVVEFADGFLGITD